MDKIERISRRDALKLAVLGMGGYALHPISLYKFPDTERLGRVCVGKVELKARPDRDSQTVQTLYSDAVVPWLREIVGRPYSIYAANLRWVETINGYIWAPHLQPVRNYLNQTIDTLPETSLGPGMWVEVTVPWVDLFLANPPARSHWLKNTSAPRFYYSQIVWVDQIKVDDGGQYWYRLNERYSYGDIFWAKAEAFRPITEEEITTINPDAEDKHIVINVLDQTLSCFEGNSEVYYCRISSGAKYNAEGKPVDEWSTPLGPHPIWRKAFSLHMSGGTLTGGYDIPGIGWVTVFVGNGVAIHATFWHNNFGVPMSHGCVNARPEDAKWIFRWTLPVVSNDPGDITVSMPGGTKVEVVEY